MTVDDFLKNLAPYNQFLKTFSEEFFNFFPMIDMRYSHVVCDNDQRKDITISTVIPSKW